MGNKEKFVFGGISPDTLKTGKQPKKKKIKITEKEISNQQDGYYCKDRVPHCTFLCDNEKCNCQFKKHRVKDVELEINKNIIIKYFTEHKIKYKYTDNLLKYEWKTDKLNGRFGKMIYDFIYQCKFVYDLDLIIEEIKKDKTAKETFQCKDRVPHNFFFCKGFTKIENGIEIKCRCSNSYFTDEQLRNEVLREWFIQKKDEFKLERWEKITLTFNWNNLSDKQTKMYNDLLLKYMKHFPIQNTQPTKKVIRKKITP